MIRIFEESVRRQGGAVFFRFADGGAEGQAVRTGEQVVSYAQARLNSIALMHQIAREGMQAGGFVAADMDNCPAFVYLLLACWYGGFKLVALNHRLTEDEKDERLAGIEEATGQVPVLLTEADVHEMIALGLRAQSEHSLVNSAQRAAVLSSPESQVVIMFTSGTTGAPKAAILPGTSLMGSARAFNEALGAGEDTLWQACLPLFHVGGLQIVVRSILNRTPFVLYRRFEAPRVLADAQRFGATHLSVVDKTLRDLLEWAEKGVHGGVSTLRAYRCILLGGATPNDKTIAWAQELQAPVQASYGMTETCSLIAASPIAEGAGRSLRLLPGYEACTFEADDYGRGQLGVAGPGLFGGYVGLGLPLTADGYYLTGDTALVQGAQLQISERTTDMFVSGGENVYPEEIRRKLLEIPGVADAYVYGTRDEKWGRRPVALVELADAQVGPAQAVALSRQVHAAAREKLARIYQPDYLFALQAFPRHGIGKIDRCALEHQAERRLVVKDVVLRRVELPFVSPVRTAKGELAQRELLVVELVDGQGRRGIGEGVAFSTDWYLPETIGSDVAFLCEQGIPRLLQDAYLHPSEAYASLASCAGAEAHRMAIAALETALWDLYGTICEQPLRELIGARAQWEGADGAACAPGMAPGGVVIGLMPVEEAVAAAREAFSLGYRRIKLKIAPGDDVERVRAVQKAVPRALLMLDANQSYTERDLDVLRKLDALGCAGIEEPLDPAFEPRAATSLIARLSKLQQQLATTIFLDESIVTSEDMREALQAPDVRGYVLKIGKFGGIEPSLQFYRAARARGAEVWMGGMFETGISKRMHAAFGLLPGISLPGDISDTARYFATDITEPTLQLANGNLLLNPPDAPYGLGCALNREALEAVTLERWDFSR